MEVDIKLDTVQFRNRLGRFAKVPEASVDAAGQAIYEYLREYHSGMSWRGSRWFQGAMSGDFAARVVEGWQPPTLGKSTIVITNTFGLLSWKVKGGSIAPKRAAFLTIPLISEARGISAGMYREMSGEKLFRAGKALCRRIGRKIEAVYAISMGVTQGPWPNAMPTHEALMEVAQRSAIGVFRAMTNE